MTRLFELRLQDAIYRLRFYTNSLIHILSLSNSHNNGASIQKNRGDKSHRVIVAVLRLRLEGINAVRSNSDHIHSKTGLPE